MNGDEIRAAYLGFFEEKGHKIMPSSSLIPHGDPTLLLTSAGMVQFKPYFLGEAKPPSPRLASVQKCFRATDIESVGDSSHLTFFEMLGNFSIGDYFKEEAIAWAWEFLTRRLGLPPKRLWITVFLDDDDAFNIWRKQGLPEDRILRYGEKDNFWGPAGDSGPCGPCSEIHYDLGEGVGCGKPSCAPDCDCGRFSEIWNLVFTQYNQDRAGKRTLLPRPNIDTGMGLERTAAVMQGKTSVYEADIFEPLLRQVAELSGVSYGSGEDSDRAMRIVAEHSRGITFLIADGVIPGKEGRGYVLRRLLRRAAVFGRRLGLEKPFLAEMAKTTIEQMGNIYPELVQRQDFTLQVIELEEERFGETLISGLQLLDSSFDYRKRHGKAILDMISFLTERKPSSENTAQILEQYGFTGSTYNTTSQIGEGIASESISELTSDLLKAFEEEEEQEDLVNEIISKIERWCNELSGYEAFKLYDTYGFPVEITQEIAAGRGFSVDMEGFEKEMEKQREKGRASHKFELAAKGGLKDSLSLPATTFVGHQGLKGKSTVVAIVFDGEAVDTIEKGQKKTALILESTPFYAEAGGQMGDTGEIIGSSGSFVVTNTFQVPTGVVIHQGHIKKGTLAVGDEVEAVVDKERRHDIAGNHTATHLLQFALRQVLGEHVQQRGSVVAADRLRFDFSHLKAMTEDEIKEVERLVNEKIRQNLPVYDEEMSYKKAIREGVIALFGEKYGDAVRVLKVGRPPLSAELCGGTHVKASGELGFFHIVSEGGIGAGLRRIEAVTGRRAEEAIKNAIDKLTKEVSAERVELEKERKKVQSLERKLARGEAESLLGRVEVVGGVRVLASRVAPTHPEALREMTDLLRERLESVVVVLGTIYEGKPLFLSAVTPDLVARGYHAGKLVNKVAEVAGGGGGGKAGLAQGGGRDKAKLDEALKVVKSLI